MEHAHAEHHGHHIIPTRLLWTVFGSLVVLTIVTVLTAKFVNLGAFNFPLAILIAIVKASLVITFFMALKWDNRVNALVLTIGCIFVLVFITITLFDTAFRGEMVDDVGIETIDMIERQDEALRAREPDPSALGISPADLSATSADSAETSADTTAETQDDAHD